MKTKTVHHRTLPLLGLVVLCSSPQAFAASTGGSVYLEFDTEMLSMSLSGGPFVMPLASDPGNALGDSIGGYGLVNSAVRITLSSQRTPAGPASPGKTFAFQEGLEAAPQASIANGNGGTPPPINP